MTQCLLGSGFLCAAMLTFGAVRAPFSAIGGIFELIAATSGIVFIGSIDGK
jgi:hypothetical protein